MEQADLIAAVDCGTTAVKAGLFDLRGSLRGSAAETVPLRFGRDGAVGFDPCEMMGAVCRVLKAAAQRACARPERVAALCVTNQRATVIPVGRRGQPLGRAISWQEMRGVRAVERVRRHISDARFSRITGLPNNPMFTHGKLLALREMEPDRFRAAERFMLVQDYALRELGATGWVTDVSNASLTGLLDITRRQWSEELLELCSVSLRRLPELVASGVQVGAMDKSAARRCGLTAGIPLVAGGGDQQCAGLGAGAVEPGIVTVTLGTAAVVMASAREPMFDKQRRIPCCVHAAPGLWAVEGLQSAAGASVLWLERLTGHPARALAAAAERVGPGARGAHFFPYLAGAAAPYWQPDARGVFMGLDLSHGPAELLRAVWEGVTFETREILDAFEWLGLSTREIRLTGGWSQSTAWQRLHADLLSRPVVTLENPQATLLGAAMLGAVGVGVFPTLKEAARRMVHTGGLRHPRPTHRAAYRKVAAHHARLRARLDRAKLFATSPNEGKGP